MFKKINTVIAMLSVILSIFGMFFNIISIIICLKRELRKSPTFIFKIFINIMNIMPLITIVLCSFIKHFIEFQLNSVNFELGKLILFLTLWSAQSSAYIQVIFFSFHFEDYFNCYFYSLASNTN
jgi:hypothetical protein